MAETRSKTSKKHDGSRSFISNLSSSLSKSKKRNIEEKQIHQPDKKWKNPKRLKSTKDAILSQPILSNMSNDTYELIQDMENPIKTVDFSEEPIYFDGSDEDTDLKDEKNEFSSKESHNDNDNLPKDVEVNISVSEDKKLENKNLYAHECNNESIITLPEINQVKTSDECKANYAERSPNNLSVPSGSNDTSADDKFKNSNAECPDTRILRKQYKDLVNVLEEIKYINVLVKKIQEDMENLAK